MGILLHLNYLQRKFQKKNPENIVCVYNLISYNNDSGD